MTDRDAVRDWILEHPDAPVTVRASTLSWLLIGFSGSPYAIRDSYALQDARDAIEVAIAREMGDPT